MKIDERHIFTGWIHVERADDVEGQWIGHCLDFDVVSVGDSPFDALRMAVEATCMVVDHDVERGVDPAARRAPAELWEPMWNVVKNGERFTGDPLKDGCQDEDSIAAMAVKVTFCKDVSREVPAPSLAKGNPQPAPQEFGFRLPPQQAATA